VSVGGSENVRIYMGNSALRVHALHAVQYWARLQSTG
jgi:hypothetical protein